MKSVDFLKAVGGVVAMVIACHTYAQASDSTAAGTMSAAPAANAKKENRALGRKVRSALAKTQGLDVSSINVRARGGAVTLTGTAPDNDQITKAGDVAKGVAGVTSVSNKINVQKQ
jgi:hyperosmotically inducible periplasmic protein